MVKGKRLQTGKGCAPPSAQPLGHEVMLYMYMRSKDDAAPVTKDQKCTCT